MRELGAKKKREFCSKFGGRAVPVLVEEKVDKATGLHRGFSRNYLPVMVYGDGNFANREIQVRLEEFRDGFLFGAPETGGDDGSPAHPQ
jgi:threonylcarbamoyladenosine tRNA methylthiotransferase MtaB